MSTIVTTNIQSDTIKHSGGTTAMTIDSVGRVKEPAKPAFNARRNGDGDIASGNRYVFTSTTVNVGNHFNTSNGTFTAPIDGTYFFNTTCLTTSNTSSNDLQIRVDGTNIAQARADVGSAAHNSVSVTVIATLTANQVVDVYIAGGGGFYGSSGFYGTFCGYLIG